MDLRQLEYFVAVAEEANFTRAAKRVHITQSGVSTQLRQLERELGADLIDRSSRAATLTVAGAAALPSARAALAAAASVRRAVDEVIDLVRGQLTVAMVTACTVGPLFDALASFHLAHPHVAITLTEGTSDQMIQDVQNSLVDVALVGFAGAPPAGLESLPIVSEGLVALVPNDHPLAGRSAVPLRTLVDEPLVCLPAGTGIRTVLDAACAARGLTAVVALQASAPSAVVDLTRRGLGVAVLSESMTAGEDDDLTRLPITGIDIPAVLALIWKAGLNPARQELVRHCQTAFGLPAPP